MSVATVDTEIQQAGAGIVWVLERAADNAPGTAERCQDFMEQAGASVGWCVGDAQTEPEAYEFDDSPFSAGRGFDLVVPRRTMVIEATSNHGTPAGNENLDGDEVLALVEQIVSEARAARSDRSP